MRELFAELSRRNRPLALVGAALLVLFAVALGLSFVDDRTVTGLNVWVKPMKFALSITIYLWTLAWFLDYLRPHAARRARFIGRSVAWVMGIEYVLVFSQAARGVTSHFNEATPYDAIVYASMGILIALNTLLVIYTLVLFLRHRPTLPTAYLWGIRLGILGFIVFGLEGAFMNVNFGHSVGVPDGGAGLPFLGWSTEAGDLRLAHFIGMHSLQVLPLVGWLLHRARARLPFAPMLGLVVFALGYAALGVFLFLQAMDGRSFFG